jgi:hypothetical protein
VRIHGVSECWSIGAMEYWNNGMVEGSKNQKSEIRAAEPQRSSGFAFGFRLRWCCAARTRRAKEDPS